MNQNTFFARYQSVTLTVLRVVAGFVMMQHGAMKLFGALGGMDGHGATVKLGSLFGFAGVLEFFVAALILIGLFTRPAAFLLAGEMAVAYFMGHAPHGFWPVLNHGEPAVLFCFIFLAISAFGAGPVSVDALIKSRRGTTKTSTAVTPQQAA